MQPARFDLQVVSVVPSAVQVSAIGQLFASQLPAGQLTSHLHESPHATSAQAFVAVHSTLHAPSPHWMSPHALLVEHAMSHDAASVQLIASHAPLAEHVITQLKPSGHTTLSPHLFGLLQTIGQLIVAKLHSGQVEGQVGLMQ
ncbi:MAG: hypothetical protein H0T89_02610 [Deltaproteobacteria bacterium]|nr:hypothetical protein [Deltaproteobacteria bacterium]MDQ3300341.1 hypothetical protein [Myxococcota bacterium]